jgi:hypothetical protein
MDIQEIAGRSPILKPHYPQQVEVLEPRRAPRAQEYSYKHLFTLPEGSNSRADWAETGPHETYCPK